MIARGRLLALGGTVLIGLGAWAFWPRAAPPAPPVVALDRAEPAVAAAIEAARAEVMGSPRSAAAWGKLGMVLSANNFPTPALECFAEAERLDPNDSRWPYLRGCTIIETEPRPGADLLARALAAAKTREVRAAARFRLAVALTDAGRLDEAAGYVAALEQDEPDAPPLWFCRAVLALARDDPATARTHLKKLLAVPYARKKACTLLSALFPDDLSLARAYESQASGLPDDLAWPDPVLDAVEEYRVVRFGDLTRVQRLNAQGQPREALELARELVAEAPDRHSWFVLAETLEQLKQYEEAERCYRAVIDLDPRHVSAHYSRGSMLFERGREVSPAAARDLFAAAVQAEDRALAIQPDHVGAHMVRGRALAALGRWDEAVRSLQAAAAGRPEVADIHFYLGEVLAQAGRTREAIETLATADRLASRNDDRARTLLNRLKAKP